MIQTKEISEKSSWESFNLASTYPSFLQSWAWGQFQKSLNRKVYRLGVFEEKRAVGVSLLVEERARVGAFLYCPGGPSFTDWKEEYLAPWTEAVRKIAAERDLAFLRIDPRRIDQAVVTSLKNLGFLTASDTQPECTALVDLKRSEPELLSAMSDSTRYNINAGRRKGVRVREGDRSEIKVFLEFLKETARRKKLILPREANYHAKQFETLAEEGLMKLFIAEASGQPLAASLLVFYDGTAYYLHAANSFQQPKLRASYPLVWHSVLAAKKRGLKLFDFWGVAPNDNPGHPWSGVTSFKLSFGAERECYVPSFDLPYRGSYKITRLLETWRKPVRKILRFGR